MSNAPGRYTSNPLLTGAWQISDWNAGQSSILRWSPKQVKWNSVDQTLDFTLDKASKGSGAGRPFVSGEVQSISSAYEGTWSWTAKAPDLVSGSIFGLFTFQADWATDDWLEFDFEFFGKDGSDHDGDGDIDIWAVRLNIHMENSLGEHVTLEEQRGSIIIPLGFDATETYATYSVKVTTSGATFFVNGEAVGTFTGADMPDGTWTVGDSKMKSFVNLWAVDPSFEGWAGKWTYPGMPMVGKLAAAEYTAPDGTVTLIGGTGASAGTTTPANAIKGPAGGGIVIGTFGSDAYEALGGDYDFQFRTKPFGSDTIYNFDPLAANPDGTLNAEHDVITISKAMAGVTGFAGLYRKITDVNGDAVLKIADGSTITFEGLKKADLSYDDFVLV
jgi:hypothetical protein